VAEFLQSPAYRAFVTGCKGFVRGDAPEHAVDTDSNATISDVGKALVRRRYRKIISAGRKIVAGTPNGELHRLRIQCKKLRYLLELLQPLYDADTVDCLIADTKRLQNVLGQHHDLGVQYTALLDYISHINPRRRREPVQLAAALGALVRSVETARAAARRKYRKRFKAFDTPATAKAIKAL
jgi:CHAD domain-containing protein